MGEVAYKPTEKVKKIYPGGTFIPPKFTPTYYEWLASKGEVIAKNGSSTSSNFTIYTVPEGKILFIFSANMQLHYGSTTGGASIDFTLLTVSGKYGLLEFIYPTGTGEHHEFNISTTFPIPVKIYPGDTIVLGGGTNQQASATFTGILIDLKDFQSI